MSLSIEVDHPWQSVPDEEEEEQEEARPRRIDFSSNAFEEKVFNNVARFKEFACIRFKNASGKTWDERSLELSKICKDIASSLTQKNDENDFLSKLSYYFSSLGHIFSNPHSPTLAIEAHAYILCIHSVCKDTLGMLIDPKDPLMWFLSIVHNFMEQLYKCKKLSGFRLTKEWMVYDLTHHISVHDNRYSFDREPECSICKETINCVAYGIQRRCDKYPFSNERPCAGHVCKCHLGVYHVECLSNRFFNHEEACPTCGSEWCLQDVVSYTVEDTKKRLKK